MIAPDWTPHQGGDCPVPPDMLVHIHLRMQDVAPAKQAYPAGKLRWRHRRDAGDIIAWRPA